MSGYRNLSNKNKGCFVNNKFITWICKKYDMHAENNLIRDFERE